LLASLAFAGCVHKQNTAQNQPALAPPIEDAPPPKPNSAPKDLPPPVITVPQPTQPAASNTPPAEPPVPKPKPHRKPKQPVNDQQQQQQPAQVASNSGAPEVSAAGQFSTGAPSDLRQQTTDSLNETERGLNGITRQLNDQEQKTSGQIKEYLKQARAALATGDVDGAHTLAQKAKFLLQELTQ
jgi:outer membrane biosynthesis protein TonB